MLETLEWPYVYLPNEITIDGKTTIEFIKYKKGLAIWGESEEEEKKAIAIMHNARPKPKREFWRWYEKVVE